MDTLGMLGLTNTGQVISSSAGAIAGFGKAVMYAVIILLILYLGYILWDKRKYRHHFIVRDLADDRVLIDCNERFAEIRTREGVDMWKLRNRKKEISPAPTKAINVDNRGNKVVTAYQTENGDLIYAIDKRKTLPIIPKELKEILDPTDRREKISLWMRENGVVEVFESYTASQKSIVVSQHRKALAKQRRPWTEQLVTFGALGILAIFGICFMIFFGKIAEPFNTMHDKEISWEQERTRQAEIDLQIVETLQSIENDVQVLKDQSDTSGGPN